MLHDSCVNRGNFCRLPRKRQKPIVARRLGGPAVRPCSTSARPFPPQWLTGGGTVGCLAPAVPGFRAVPRKQPLSPRTGPGTLWVAVGVRAGIAEHRPHSRRTSPREIAMGPGEERDGVRAGAALPPRSPVCILRDRLLDASGCRSSIGNRACDCVYFSYISPSTRSVGRPFGAAPFVCSRDKRKRCPSGR
jgi:hypothetical protein